MKFKLLITGGAGFIGSHFIKMLLKEIPENWEIINLDNLTYASNLEVLEEFEKYRNYSFIKGDIRDQKFIENLFLSKKVNSVIHFAAESHVDNSIKNPKIFLETNILGTQNLLEASRKSWMKEPFQLKEEFKNSRFHHVSTDEVYGSLSLEEKPFSEDHPYSPNSPYSASKASSDFIVRSYGKTYGMPYTITNCSNNYGSFQNDEKLIPTIIRNALEEKEIPIYGDGKNIRDWLYVKDHCSAIWEVFKYAPNQETYNIGANEEHSNLDIVENICSTLDKIKPRQNCQKYKDLILFVKDRPGHDRRYAINSNKIKKDLNWTNQYSFQVGLEKTIQWYIDKYGKKSFL